MDTCNRKESQECRGQNGNIQADTRGLHSRGTPEALSLRAMPHLCRNVLTHRTYVDGNQYVCVEQECRPPTHGDER